MTIIIEGKIKEPCLCLSSTSLSLQMQCFIKGTASGFCSSLCEMNSNIGIVCLPIPLPAPVNLDLGVTRGQMIHGQTRKKRRPAVPGLAWVPPHIKMSILLFFICGHNQSRASSTRLIGRCSAWDLAIK